MLNDNAIEDAYLEKLYAQRVEAIIQIGCRVDDFTIDPSYVEHINRVTRTIPFISSGKLDGTGCYSLRIDNAAAMMKVMDYLVALGHRDIALFGGAKQVLSTYEKRQQYIYFLGAHGLSFREDYMQESDYSGAGGYACMKRLLQCKPMPTAVIAINDYSAVGAMRAVFEAGLSIPGDLSLVSFDNTFLSEIVQPKLTSVDYSYREYGEKFIDIALQAIQKADIPRECFIEPRLVVRDSCKKM
jgi:DNA-binding LacI/PurR family transcriptional regulator